ncbi:hypothetical protein L1N85_19440 [Paenibacillus alkaliterrae]|uniref:hypothetical protein n=1 Tax=Paenibacillus alkaliterrae TaxID=320909 RepID=UPI001F187475|nr:hypothetical protein [Paenibacillus alkaliterrae]MCF2940570.1 hypothetical protein [Paenibacillus alkaliterrae]
MQLMMWLLLAAFTLGSAMVFMPIALSIKFRNRLRLPSARNKRRQTFQEYLERTIKNQNTKKSNYKLLRRLKTAGYPFGMQAFHFRLTQLMAPIFIAVFCMTLYMIKNTISDYPASFPIFTFIFLVVIGYTGPSILLLYYANKRREVLAEEIVKFSHRLVVCITDKIPLYYAIRRAGRTCKVLKPYIDDMLIDWMDNPRAAINHFGDQVGINEVLPVTNTLLASWNASQDKIIDLFHQQIRNIDTMRDFQIKKKIEAGPLRVTFIILIPFLAAGALVVLPWYNSFMETLRQTF